jgi:hypothetical protein
MRLLLTGAALTACALDAPVRAAVTAALAALSAAYLVRIARTIRRP